MRLSEHTEWASNLLRKTFGHIEIKVIASGIVSCLGFLFDNLLKEAMLALLILIIFDFVTGIGASKKEGKIISSNNAVRTAFKTALYFMVISSGRLAEHATHHILPFIDETIISFLAVTELISILENTGRLGFAIPQKLLNRLKEYRDEK